MPAIRPTHTALTKATATSSDTWYSIDGHRGLWLRARPGLAKTWVFRSVIGGTQKKIVLGRWPETSFDDARRAMDLLRHDADGANPIDARRHRLRADKDAVAAAKNAALLRPTVSQLATRYLGQYVSAGRRGTGKKRSSAEDQRLFMKHVAPALGMIKADELRSKDVSAMRESIEASSEKRKAIAVLRALLSHAKSDGLVENNVALGIKSPPSGQRDRVLSDEEIQKLWRATGETVPGIRSEMLAALRLQLLTAQRIGEVLSLRWADVDHDARTWFLPAEIAKNGRANLIPLSQAAFSIVFCQPRTEDYVFTGHRVTPVSSSAFAQVVERVRVGLSLEDFTSHDLRRTAATRMAALGVAPHIIEAILNHSGGAISGIARIYNRHSYQDEKRVALNAWADELARIGRTAKRREPANYFRYRALRLKFQS
jgi:integrase